MGAYGVEEQLFARCPLGKIWVGSAALEKVFIWGAVGKKFQEAGDPPFRISKIFSLYGFPKFCYISHMCTPRTYAHKKVFLHIG
jgi:hypothetical protein